jgi:hypothetical protein
MLAIVAGVIHRVATSNSLATGAEEAIGLISLISVVISLIALPISGFVLYWIGDAARYLDSLPANILERQAIRSDGVKLLRRLHRVKDGDKPKYDRVIIIGHSLGSVIGYDILKFYWANVNEQLLIAPTSPANGQLKHLQQVAAVFSKTQSVKDDAARDYQNAQAALMAAIPSPAPWRITDFISLGSPLTHADFLLASSRHDLDLLKQQLELPTCPPQEDEAPGLYSYPAYNAQEGYIGEHLHHAAHFAMTKWTNLYVPQDLIGGPVGHLFGAGVLDIQCNLAPDRGLFSWPLRWIRAHTWYWHKDRTVAPDSVAHLKAIVSWPS